MSRWFLLAIAALPLSSPVRAGGKVDFSREILPIFSENCFYCHGPDPKVRKAKLRLDDEKSAKAEVIVPGKSGDSEVFRRITATDPAELMPPPRSNHKLTAGQIELVRRWIDEGAVWGEHWAFTKITRPEPPTLKRLGDRARTPVDHFIFARLEKDGLEPAARARRETLIRRVSLDLTGLPPTPEEVDAFVADTSHEAYDKVVKRLLESPHYGERMAWEWLDAARYADSNGYQGDNDRTMWPWRDWVVAAFNRNMPYDQFTVWQLAGDLLPNATQEQKLATAFCRNHMINGEGGRIPEENRVDYVMDMSETTGTVWLGLTLNCCRCHDHKFDPLSRRDYYQLFAFFNQTPVNGGGDNPQTPPVLELVADAQKAELAKLEDATNKVAAKVDAFERDFFPRAEKKTADESEKAAGLSDELKKFLRQSASNRGRTALNRLQKQFEKEAPEYVKTLQELRSEIDRRETFNRSLPRIMIMEDMPKARETFMLDKGIYDKHGEAVKANTPTKLPPLPADAPHNRLGLAKWLVAPENPLPARVTVNRFWQQFFGIGLVKTPEDFGVQAEPPSHRELLDWLAAEFIASGWDVKALCRLIVTSEAYQQSAQVTPALLERDPHNRLLARGPRYRLPSWMLRDQALAASGLLVRTLGGAPTRPYQPGGVWEEATFGNRRYQQDQGDALYRRSVYTFWRRIIAPTMFFDTASRQTCWVKQTRTNTPLHALATLNDVTYVEAARALAQRVMKAETTPERRLEEAYRRVLARRPSAEEAQVLRASLDRVCGEFVANPEAARKALRAGASPRDEGLDAVEHAAYAVVCHAILNLDEALNKE